MIKFTVKILLCCITLSCFSFSHATLITNLTQTELDARDYTNAEDKLFDTLLDVNYITRFGYDWAWASPVNVEYSASNNNTLYAPQVQQNWQFATGTSFQLLQNNLTLADFTKSNGEIIQAAKFFNSVFESVHSAEFDTRSSELYTPTGSFMDAIFSGSETFYVRPSHLRPSSPTVPVPEPSTIMIFALGLIALATKKRLMN